MQVVRKQKEIIKRLIEMKRKKLQKVYPGLTCFKDGVRQIPIESIPGVVEAGFKSLDTMYKHYYCFLGLDILVIVLCSLVQKF